MPVGDRFQVTAGVTGSKYHFDRSAWNDYGFFGNASFMINNNLSLNAFGQYHLNQQFHSVAAMPFLGTASYGGTLGWRATDYFSLDVGARRIYDPYTGKWRTLPIVQPTISLVGVPISFDAGPLLYQLIDVTPSTALLLFPTLFSSSQVLTPTVLYPYPTPSATNPFFTHNYHIKSHIICGFMDF